LPLRRINTSLHSVSVFNFKNIGITNTNATIENNKPPVEPTANENQNDSFAPSIKPRPAPEPSAKIRPVPKPSAKIRPTPEPSAKIRPAPKPSAKIRPAPEPSAKNGTSPRTVERMVRNTAVILWL